MDSLDPSIFFHQVKAPEPWNQVVFGSDFTEAIPNWSFKSSFTFGKWFISYSGFKDRLRGLNNVHDNQYLINDSYISS